jgi:hypothetical protein
MGGLLRLGKDKSTNKKKLGGIWEGVLIILFIYHFIWFEHGYLFRHGDIKNVSS